MTCYVVVEGQFDRVLLERFLYSGQVEPRWTPADVQLVVAQGASAAIKSARTILATRRGPVALLCDADAYKPMAVAERREAIEEALGQFAQAQEFSVITFVPEMETVLFQSPSSKSVLEKIQPLSEQEVVQSKYEPKEVIVAIARRNGIDPGKLIRDAIDAIDPKDLVELAPFRELQMFLMGWMSEAAE